MSDNETEPKKPTSKELKDAVLRELIDTIRDGHKVVIDGKVETVSAPASILTVALAYLKRFPPVKDADETEVERGELGDALRNYSARMPFGK